MEKTNLGSIGVEFLNARLGDKRLTERLCSVAEALERRPEQSIPKAVGISSQIEGTYRLLNHTDVEADRILKPHIRASCERAKQAGEIFAIHDTTTFQFEGEQIREGLGWINHPGQQGFFGHFTLAVAHTENPIPLGILAMEPFLRTGTPKSRGGTQKQIESQRWGETANKVEALFVHKPSIIHVMDREADDYKLFCALREKEFRFVIRVNSNRRVKLQDDAHFVNNQYAFRKLNPIFEREVSVSRRVKKTFSRHPARKKRVAKLSFFCAPAEIRRGHHHPKEISQKVPINIVKVLELAPPEGEEAIEWVLFTSEPIETEEQVAKIVDIYRCRWLIEEYFKALKSGCAFEERQLESYKSLTNLLAILIPVAWRLLLLRHLSRTQPDVPASFALTNNQIDVLRVILELKHKIKLRNNPSAHEALMGVAKLGGHLKQNGPPGWMVLARGLHDLLQAELGWIAAHVFMSQRSDQ